MLQIWEEERKSRLAKEVGRNVAAVEWLPGLQEPAQNQFDDAESECSGEIEEMIFFFLAETNQYHHKEKF